MPRKKGVVRRTRYDGLLQVLPYEFCVLLLRGGDAASDIWQFRPNYGGGREDCIGG